MQKCRKRRSDGKQKWCRELAAGRKLSCCLFPSSSAQQCVCKKADFSPPTIALSEKIPIKVSFGLIGIFLKKMQLPVG